MTSKPTNNRELIAMIGTSMSGKIYFVDNNLSGYQIVSCRHIKNAISTTRIKSDEDFLYACMDVIVRSHMIKGLPVVVVENNLSLESLIIWKNTCKEFNYRFKGILLDTPLEVCIERMKFLLNAESVSEETRRKFSEEYEKMRELKIILKLKHHQLLDEIVFVNYDGGNI